MLKLFDFRWLAVAMLFSVAAIPSPTQANTPTVVFSEIAWAGSWISASDEWIELTNVSDAPIDLSGWTLTGAGSSGKDLVFPNGSVVEPQSTFLIANYEYTHKNSALATASQYVTTTLSLPNDGFTLTLLDGSGTIIDVAGGAGAPFAGGSGGTGDSIDGRYRSMVRGTGLNDGSLPDSWASADTSQGFKEGVLDYGTPGEIYFTTTSVIPSDSEESPREEPTESGDLSSPAAPQDDNGEVVQEEVVAEVQDQMTVEEVSTEEPVSEQDNEAQTLTEESVADESVQSDLPAQSASLGNIRIDEFVVDPLGDGVEWIELFNGNDIAVTLVGWSIEDHSGKATDLSNVSIESYGYVVIESPKGKLNNDGDSIILKDANGQVVEIVVYGGDGYPIPKKGEALARNGDTFELTELSTPGSPNLIFVTTELVEEEPPDVVIPTTSSDNQTEEGSPNVVQESLVNEIPKTLHFVSLYPNTTGSDETEEYIVIKNIGTESIDLLDWSIEDGSTKVFTFNESISLAAQTTIQIGRPQSKLTLNNGGDTLELIAPDGEVVDLVSYGNTAKGQTYDLVNGSWMWSGEATISESYVDESLMTATTTTSSSTTTNATHVSSASSTRVAQFMTIGQAKQKTDGEKVIVKGVVTSSPGTFGSQIFYIQDETGGIQVYLYSSEFPELSVGDIVQVTGELSTSRGERRVKLSSAAGVVSASGAFESQPVELDIDQINESHIGLLIVTQGLIQSIDTNKLIVERAGATLIIYLKSNPVIDAGVFERGDALGVTGVLTSYDGELRLRPRFLQDIAVTQEAPVATATATESNEGSNTGLALLFITVVALAGFAAWRYLPRRGLAPSAA